MRLVNLSSQSDRHEACAAVIDIPIININLKFRSDDLLAFAVALLTEAGLTNHQSADTARVLVEGDLSGHSTHGLQLLPAYLRSALPSVASAGPHGGRGGIYTPNPIAAGYPTVPRSERLGVPLPRALV